MRLLCRCLLIIGLFSLNGCSGENGDVVAYVDSVKKTAGGKINELPPAKPAIVEEYTAENLRSPFDESVVKEVVVENKDDVESETTVKQQPKPDASRTRYFLEKYPLNSFIMVGTLKKENHIWGIVEDQAGLVRVVKVGDYIGQNSGKIVSISEDSIKLIETVPDGNGGWTKINSEIVLKQD